MVEQVGFAFLPGIFDRPVNERRIGNRNSRKRPTSDLGHVHSLFVQFRAVGARALASARQAEASCDRHGPEGTSLSGRSRAGQRASSSRTLALQLFGAKQLNRVGPKSNCAVRRRGPNLGQLTAKKRLKKRDCQGG